MEFDRPDDILKIPFIIKNDVSKSFTVNIRLEDEDELNLDDIVTKAKEKFKKYNGDLHLKFEGTKDYKEKDLDLAQSISYYKDLWPFFSTYVKEEEDDDDDDDDDEAFGAPPLPDAFVDVSNENNLRQLDISKEAPKWRYIKDGLNIICRCKKQDCPAYGHDAICPLGFVVFDLVLDSGRVLCPVCKEYAEPSTCGFTSCVYKFNGRKIGARGKPENFRGKEKRVGDTFEYFDPVQGGSVKWGQLKIICKKLVSNEDTNNSETCNLCDKIVTAKTKVECKCGHSYHKTCLDELKKSNIDIHKGCIHCSV